MGRKIVLKGVLFIAVVGFVLVFSSFQKDEKKIIGKWKHEKIEIKELSCSDMPTDTLIRTMWAMVPDFIDELVIIIEFTKNKKVIVTGNEFAAYKIMDNKLTIILDGGESMTCDYFFPDKKTMCLFVDFLELRGGTLDISGLIGEEIGAESDAVITKFIIGMTFTKQ